MWILLELLEKVILHATPAITVPFYKFLHFAMEIIFFQKTQTAAWKDQRVACVLASRSLVTPAKDF